MRSALIHYPSPRPPMMPESGMDLGPCFCPAFTACLPSLPACLHCALASVPSGLDVAAHIQHHERCPPGTSAVTAVPLLPLRWMASQAVPSQQKALPAAPARGHRGYLVGCQRLQRVDEDEGMGPLGNARLHGIALEMRRRHGSRGPRAQPSGRGAEGEGPRIRRRQSPPLTMPTALLFSSFTEKDILFCG